MTVLDDALQSIRERRSAASERGVQLIGVVGSVARGEDGPNSDVDIVYDIVGRSSLLAIARALIDLEADLGRRVDLVDISRVEPDIRAAFEHDLVKA